MKLKPVLMHWLARIDALPQRDRWAVAAGVVALSVAAQWLLVAPARERRLEIENSAQAEGVALFSPSRTNGRGLE